MSFQIDGCPWFMARDSATIARGQTRPCYRPTVTDDTHEAITAIAQAIAAAAKAGRWDEVASLRLEMSALRKAFDVDKSVMNVHDKSDMMTDAARGQRIAQGHAVGDILLEEIAASPWRSAANYSRKSLKLAPSTFSQYRTGKVDPPDTVKAKVRKDFPKAFKRGWDWPKTGA